MTDLGYHSSTSSHSCVRVKSRGKSSLTNEMLSKAFQQSWGKSEWVTAKAGLRGLQCSWKHPRLPGRCDTGSWFQRNSLLQIVSWRHPLQWKTKMPVLLPLTRSQLHWACTRYSSVGTWDDFPYQRAWLVILCSLRETFWTRNTWLP